MDSIRIPLQSVFTQSPFSCDFSQIIQLLPAFWQPANDFTQHKPSIIHEFLWWLCGVMFKFGKYAFKERGAVV